VADQGAPEGSLERVTWRYEEAHRCNSRIASRLKKPRKAQFNRRSSESNSSAAQLYTLCGGYLLSG
jgi:hypothetical protein